MRPAFKILLLASVVLSTFAACNKDEEQTPLELFQMTAGAIDPNGLHHDYQPNLSLQMKHVTCFGMRDTLAIDLNADNSNDIVLFFEDADGLEQCECFYAEIPPDDTTIVDCFPVTYIAKYIKVINPNLQVAAEMEHYSSLVLPFEAGAAIDETLAWEYRELHVLFRASYMFGFSPPMGHWQTGTHYAAIRFVEPNDTLYGWIRLNTDTVITALDYALEQ